MKEGLVCVFVQGCRLGFTDFLVLLFSVPSCQHAEAAEMAYQRNVQALRPSDSPKLTLMQSSLITRFGMPRGVTFMFVCFTADHLMRRTPVLDESAYQEHVYPFCRK